MARSGITVRVEGIDLLRTRLEDLPEEVLAAIKKALRESAESVRDNTSAGVRVDTGNLRDSVDVRYDDDGLTARVGWFDDEDQYAAHHEHGTSKVPARPALGPAIEEERTRLEGRLKEHVRQALR